MALCLHGTPLQAIQNFSFSGTRKFDVDDFPGFQAGEFSFQILNIVFMLRN